MPNCSLELQLGIAGVGGHSMLLRKAWNSIFPPKEISNSKI